MTRETDSLKKILLTLTTAVCIFAASEALAGAIAGGEEDNSCDKRRLVSNDSNLNFCSPSVRKNIGDTCYVVVHSVPLSGRKCSWQGCGSLSLVGRPATLLNSNSQFMEYGSVTSRSNAAFANSPNGAGVLPKHPYPRHYLTVKEAHDALRACPGNPYSLPEPVRAAICNADQNMLKLNPYWHCYISTD